MNDYVKTMRQLSSTTRALWRNKCCWDIRLRRWAEHPPIIRRRIARPAGRGLSNPQTLVWASRGFELPDQCEERQLQRELRLLFPIACRQQRFQSTKCCRTKKCLPERKQPSPVEQRRIASQPPGGLSPRRNGRPFGALCRKSSGNTRWRYALPPDCSIGSLRCN